MTQSRRLVSQLIIAFQVCVAFGLAFGGKYYIDNHAPYLEDRKAIMVDLERLVALETRMLPIVKTLELRSPDDVYDNVLVLRDEVKQLAESVTAVRADLREVLSNQDAGRGE